MKRLSLRWKLVLVSGSLALVTTLVVGTMLDLRAEDQLLKEVGNTLETKCDEIITVLEDPDLSPTIEEFLVIETRYRYSPYTYFYDIRDTGGRIIGRSTNLERFVLPLPSHWDSTTHARSVHVGTAPAARGDDSLLVRTERLEVSLHGRERRTVIIQTAVSLGAWKTNVRGAAINDAIVAALVLIGVFLLIWFLTTASLRPVAAITKKAAQINAKNLRDRLPVAGRGDELDDLATVLNGMLDRLGNSMQQIEEFSADAAHQLRTPLTRIRGSLDLILHGEVANPLRGKIEGIHDEVVRLSHLCGRLLLLGRLEFQTGEATLTQESVDLKEIAEELVEQWTPTAHERGIALSIDTAVTARMRGNRILLVEALLNLLDNAIRWTPSGGSIRVSVDAGPDILSLSVADSGPGVPVQDRERIFQPFYRGRENSLLQPSDGSGLGLAIVRAVARVHSGRVEFTESLPTGSVLRLSFPAR